MISPLCRSSSYFCETLGSRCLDIFTRISFTISCSLISCFFARSSSLQALSSFCFISPTSLVKAAALCSSSLYAISIVEYGTLFCAMTASSLRCMSFNTERRSCTSCSRWVQFSKPNRSYTRLYSSSIASTSILMLRIVSKRMSTLSLTSSKAASSLLSCSASWEMRFSQSLRSS